MARAITAETIFTGNEQIKGKALLIENDHIKAIVAEAELPGDIEILNYPGSYVAPGLIDLQIYGGGGFLFSNDPSVEALHAMTMALLKTGTTGFLITLATNSMDVFRKAIDVVKNNPHPAVLGLHFEGPYINPVKKGAHLEQFIKKPELDEIKALVDYAGGVIKMMTLAPEHTHASVIRHLISNNIVVSAGHSNASFQEAKKGFGHGIQAATHLFNAMSAFHHRDTGLPGAIFQSDNVYASIIADGIHVDYNTVAISKKILKERLFFITDAVEENREGAYIHVKQPDRFTLPDGTLSGSCLTLLNAVQNVLNHAGISLEEALRMASTYPAQLIKTNDRGILKAGARADLIVFNKNFEIKEVFLNGHIV